MLDGGRMKDPVNRVVTSALARLGFSGRRSATVKREAWWWLTARASTLRSGSPHLMTGRAVVFGPGGRVELAPIDVPPPAPGEVRLRMLMTALSPGTERARYLGLPHARVKPGYIPGFSGVAEVLHAGRDVAGVEPGTRVMVINGPHQSVVNVAADRLLPTPADLDDEAAAFGHLGAISLFGVDLGGAAGRDVAVMGAGLIGTLAQRLAAVEGAATTTLIARSGRRFREGEPSPDRYLTTQDESDTLDRSRFPVVIDATGDPDALVQAVRIVDDGGDLVLLGSSRGSARPFPTDQVLDRRLTVIGAHIRAAATQPVEGNHNAVQQLGSRVIAHLAAGRLQVDDLVDEITDPREPEPLYRRLVRDPGLVGALFDWRDIQPSDGARAWLRRPELTGRGIDHNVLPLRNPRVRTPRSRTGLHRGSTELGIGFVGCGDVALLNAAAVDAATGLHLAATYDTVPELGEDLVQRFGGEATSSLDELLSHRHVEAVFINVPHHLHADLAIRALESGKHVIVEKPPAHHLRDAVRMVEFAERLEPLLSFCLPSRFEPESIVARQLLESGAVGAPTGGSVAFLADRPPGYYHGGLSGRTVSDWRTDPARSGGGVTIMNLTHQLDLLLHLVDEPIATVSSYLDSSESPAGVEDTVAIIIRFAGGAVATVQGATAVRGTNHERFALWGPDGHLELQPTPQVFSLRALPGYRPGRWQRVATPDAAPPRVSYLEAFAAAVRGEAASPVPPREGLYLQAVVEAIYRAAAEQVAVEPGTLLEEQRP